jgi:phosphatidate phosphatase APP1
MNRPYLVSFSAVASDEQIAVKASVTNSYTPLLEKRKRKSQQIAPTSPIQSIRLISGEEFRLKMVGMNDSDEEVFIREYDSDSFGNFDIKIPSRISNKNITKLLVYEVTDRPGLQLHLGSFIPLNIENPKKIIISDFDKTLCDTKFSTAKEMYTSLRKPLDYFPTIDKSVEMLKDHVEKGFHPFILSASPHFYENAIRDWLYKNKIYAGNIFLKDYRNIFSLSEGVLTPKDMKKQGFYKLSQLVNILSMTGIPDELVLMGDGFESDNFIYLTLAAILVDQVDPWKIWNQIKKESAFKLTTKQNFQFLSKFYQIGEKTKNKGPIKLDIHIRCNESIYERCQAQHFKLKFLEKNSGLVKYYLG